MTVAWPRDLAPDPAPGEPAELHAAARAAGRTARQLWDSAAALRSVAADDALWTGAAAAAFRGRLGALPADLDRAAGALAEVERALAGYAVFLDDAQTRARALAADWRTASGPPAAAGTPAAAGRDPAEFLVRADALAGEVHAASRRAEAVVRRAAAQAPRDPGWLGEFAKRVDRAVGTFVRENAQAIRLALAVLTVVQFAVGVAAPVAGALVLINIGASLLLYRYDQASTSDVAWAFAGGLVGPAAKAVMSERVVTTAVAAAPGRAKGAVEGGVRAASPVARDALHAVDAGMTAQGTVDAVGVIGSAAARGLRRDRNGSGPTPQPACAPASQPSPRPSPGPSTRPRPQPGPAPQPVAAS